MNQDQEHLRLLSIFHYVVGGLTALFACFPVIHLTVGLVMLFAPGSFENGQHGSPNDPSALRFMGLFFTIFAGGFILAGWSFATCVFLAGRFLSRRRHYTFCLVMAGLLCMNMPFGTVLGVFTIIVLIRPSVKLLFQPQAMQCPFKTVP
jgi:hypothetical protein